MRVPSLAPGAYRLLERALRVKNRLIGIGWHGDPRRHFGPGGTDEAEAACLEAGRDFLAYLRPAADARADRLALQGAHTTLAFDSPLPSGREPNDRVVARIFTTRKTRHGGPALVFHHPLYQRHWSLWGWFLAPLTEVYPVVMMAAPYHFERTPPGEFAGEGMVNPNPYRLFEALRQWAWDQRALMNALPGIGLQPRAVVGFSLGAFSSLLVAAAGGLPELPIVSIASTNRYAFGLYNGELGTGTVDGFRRVGLGRERIERMVGAIQLERYAPLLRNRRVLFIAGEHDAVDPPPSGARLEAALMPERSIWLPVGHSTAIFARELVARETVAFLETPPPRPRNAPEATAAPR